MYAKYFKRGIDFILSLCALIVLSPVLLILIILGTVFMGGNPFFTQERPGKAEKIFKLIKFRTMSDKMAIIGPRPLLVRYLARYNEEQHHRHDVRPGLTGYAQAHGRNAVSWEDKFAMDVWYTTHITFVGDIKIIIDTIKSVLKHEGISSETSATMEEFMGTPECISAKWKAPVEEN